jgi:hypothetical protein
MTDQRTFRLRAGVLLSVMALSLIAAPASATHFRYGHITWTPRPDIHPNAVDFTVQNVWRRDAYSTSNGRCINPATLASTPCTGPGGFAGVGDLIRELQGTPRLDPGDGSPLIGGPPGLASALLYQVTAIDAANNWAFGLAVDPADLAGGTVDTDITHIYPAVGNYTAQIDDCCRVSACVSPTGHMNNPDGAFRVTTLVTVTAAAANSSPVSALPPIILCPINGLCEFTVPASDNELDPLTFRLATPTESGLERDGWQPHGARFLHLSRSLPAGQHAARVRHAADAGVRTDDLGSPGQHRGVHGARVGRRDGRRPQRDWCPGDGHPDAGTPEQR